MALRNQVDPTLLDEQAELSPDERLRRSLDWNAFATEIAAAGARARTR